MVVQTLRKTDGPPQSSPEDGTAPAEGVLFFPGPEKTANDDDLAQVIRVVIGHKKSLAQNRLSRAVRNFREEIRPGIRDHFFHRSNISREGFQTLVPCLWVRRCLSFRPISGGPIRRYMFWVARKFEDVPLRDSHVLEQFPNGIRHPIGTDSPQFGRNAGKRSFPIEMSIATRKKIDEMFSQ